MTGPFPRWAAPVVQGAAPPRERIGAPDILMSSNLDILTSSNI
ncbi:hypothetical protein GZL_07228 [Streptomyces sp. 769]|nr:hypothetical protein GZL_07228 [Streptomyces sp. 769]